jgi:hypothetical protein
MRLDDESASPSRRNADQVEADEKAHAKHVADLVKRGIVKLGKSGPPLKEILAPGPAAPNALKALRWSRRKR